MHGKIRVGVNGYGVIGKRVADAISAQQDMTLIGVADVATDWRSRVLQAKEISLFAGTSDALQAFEAAGIVTAGGLSDLLRRIDYARPPTSSNGKLTRLLLLFSKHGLMIAIADGCWLMAETLPQRRPCFWQKPQCSESG